MKNNKAPYRIENLQWKTTTDPFIEELFNVPRSTLFGDYCNSVAQAFLLYDACNEKNKNKKRQYRDDESVMTGEDQLEPLLKIAKTAKK